MLILLSFGFEELRKPTGLQIIIIIIIANKPLDAH